MKTYFAQLIRRRVDELVHLAAGPFNLDAYYPHLISAINSIDKNVTWSRAARLAGIARH
jgi:hypothetical protein